MYKGERERERAIELQSLTNELKYTKHYKWILAKHFFSDINRVYELMVKICMSSIQTD